MCVCDLQAATVGLQTGRQLYDPSTLKAELPLLGICALVRVGSFVLIYSGLLATSVHLENPLGDDPADLPALAYQVRTRRRVCGARGGGGGMAEGPGVAEGGGVAERDGTADPARRTHAGPTHTHTRTRDACPPACKPTLRRGRPFAHVPRAPPPPALLAWIRDGVDVTRFGTRRCG